MGDEFNCEFNAPQFFDFAALNAAGADPTDPATAHDDEDEVNKYFGKLSQTRKSKPLPYMTHLLLQRSITRITDVP